MKTSRLSALAVLSSWALASALQAQTSPFAARFEEIKKTATKQELYAFLWALPKGGDLHNHFGLSFHAYQLYEAGTDKKLLKGNEFFTRVRFQTCPGDEGPFIPLSHDPEIHLQQAVRLFEGRI